MQNIGMVCSGFENNFIHVPIKSMVRDAGDFMDTIPVIKDLVSNQPVSLLVLVQIAENPGSAGVYPISWSFGCVSSGGTSGYCTSSGGIVCCVCCICFALLASFRAVVSSMGAAHEG